MNSKSIFVVILMVAGLVSCENKLAPENAKLQAQVDSLQTAMESKLYTEGLMEQMGQYLDSIDMNRNWVEVNLETGVPTEDYIERMKRLNAYVQKAEATIKELEKSKGVYAAQIKRLKQEIIAKDNEIKLLQSQVAMSQEETRIVSEKLQVSEQQLSSTRKDLSDAQSKITNMNDDIAALNDKATLTQAESYYNQGENYEQLADHIQLAPKKKKQALRDALDFYKKADELGYAPAKEKIKLIESKLNK